MSNEYKEDSVASRMIASLTENAETMDILSLGILRRAYLAVGPAEITKGPLEGQYKFAGLRVEDEQAEAIGACASPTCRGHDTPKGAVRHMRMYMLQNGLRFFVHERGRNQLRPCRECGQMTSGYACLSYGWDIVVIVPLCCQHHTRKVVSRHFHIQDIRFGV